jgi:hypothetical protein
LSDHVEGQRSVDEPLDKFQATHFLLTGGADRSVSFADNKARHGILHCLLNSGASKRPETGMRLLQGSSPTVPPTAARHPIPDQEFTVSYIAIGHERTLRHLDVKKAMVESKGITTFCGPQSKLLGSTNRVARRLWASHSVAH